MTRVSGTMTGMIGSERRGETGLRPWMKGATIAVLAAAVSWLHYGTSPGTLLLHEVYQYLYYLPLVLAAYWGGIGGGLAAAALISLLFVPHVRAMSHTYPAYSTSMYAHAIAFYLLGGAVGLAVSAQRRLAARERATAASLQKANRELQESDEQLRRADRLAALGEIAAGLAHEIKNPLAGTKGALEIIQARVRADTPEGEFAAIAARELQRLEQLVGDFLAYARPRLPQRTAQDLRILCDEVRELLKLEADRAEVTLQVATETADPAASADRAQIEQVLVNVVLNAIQASPRGGVVILRIRGDADVHVDVEDAGPPIPDAVVARMFDPFFTTKERGTGLGLAISQRIVAAHGGAIEIEARAGGGTCVTVSLPRPAVAATGAEVGREQYASD